MENYREKSMPSSTVDNIKKHLQNYKSFFDGVQVYIPEKGVLAGPDKFEGVNYFDWFTDNLHFSLNPYFLTAGYMGIAEEARKGMKGDGGDGDVLLDAIAEVYSRAADYLKRHAEQAEAMAVSLGSGGTGGTCERERFLKIAENCRVLSENPPQTFQQAVQLFWMSWRLRAYNSTATIGRLDQYLYPFYKTDMKCGMLTRGEALEIIVELWERINNTSMGDTLINLMLGGQDENGNDQTNELSYIMLEATLAVRKSEPHMNARIHKNTPPDFWNLLIDVQMLGHGQGTIYNDEFIIPSLVKYGYTPEQAYNYSNDGCTEVMIDGDSNIVFVQGEAMKSLELALFNGRENKNYDGAITGQYWHKDGEVRPLQSRCELGFESGDVRMMTSFEEVYQAYLRQYKHQLKKQMDGLANDLERRQTHDTASLWLQGTHKSVLETGVDLFRNPRRVDMVMVLLGSIPTVADSLAAVRKVVFEERFCTMTELLAALEKDFDGHEVLRVRLLRAPKFGNDDDFVDNIASRLSSDLMDFVDACSKECKVRFLPALYDYLFNDFAKLVGATPDGRKRFDVISEHYSPTPGRAANGPTAIIKSAVKTDLARAIGASPLYISLQRTHIGHGAEGKQLIKTLNEAALRLGITILNVAIYDVEKLREAQRNPAGHEDLIVRVWGYCARFVDLTEDMQNHIIKRVCR